MSTIINADTSNGLKLTSDTSGEIELQSAGVTKAKVTSSGLQNASGNPITAQAGKNFIINGDMRVAQRATSVTGITTSGFKTVDRSYNALSFGTTTQEQSTDSPDDFNYSFKTTFTTGATPTSSQLYQYNQLIEGNNLPNLMWGTASAKSVTVSFWMKSNVTGNRIARLYMPADGGTEQSIQAVVTQNVADTWEKKTVTFAGNTSKNLAIGTSEGIRFTIWLGAGTGYTSGTLSTIWENYDGTKNAVGISNIGTATSDYFAITGVQLEAGTVATEFENLMYSQQLSMCQRYYFNFAGTLHGADYSANGFVTGVFPTEMRVAPTITYSAARTPLAGVGFGYTKPQFFSGFMGATPYVSDLKANAEL